MKTSIIYWGIICFIFLSCSQSSSKKDVTEIVITNSVPELSLTHDSLTAINEIGIGDIAVADTFLMILQPDKEDILNVYSLPTLRFAGACQKMGGGPNELVYPAPFTQSFKKKGEICTVMRSYQKFTALLNLTQSLAERQTVYDEKYTYQKPVGQESFRRSSITYLLGDSILLLNENPGMRSAEEEANDLFEVYDYRQDKIVRSFYASDFPDIVKNINGGSTFWSTRQAIRSDCRKLAIAYRLFNIINIVDIPTGKVKTLYTGGEKPNWEKAIGTPKEHYSKLQCDEKYIWAMTTDHTDPSHLYSKLEVYDWDGNYLHKINLDQPILMFALDNKHGYMYAVTTDDELIRYNTQELLSRLPQ
ncbi:hypothetical protein IN666_16855 [Bacteroides fragilis]|uniref:BF3164 family lipoprotein n=1 Tax=Bacteroides fragilis TaxID=817 RepID=UPI00187A50A4|nr:BF3164 family lipoprotein [Bacteroides fragilis]MBE7401153.1 hypothetical protein [Bacteroides fragilis]